MHLLRSIALTTAVIAAPACITGPKPSLSGDWVGGGVLLSLHQSGSVVTGMSGGTPCFGTAVAGSIHGEDFQLTFDTGTSATTYAGKFVSLSTISMNRTPAPLNVSFGPILLSKESAAALGKCLTNSHE